MEAGCDRTTVSLIERVLVSPKLDTIVRMCRVINARPCEESFAIFARPFSELPLTIGNVRMLSMVEDEL